MKGESKYQPILSVMDMRSGLRIVYREDSQYSTNSWTYLEYNNRKVL